MIKMMVTVGILVRVQQPAHILMSPFLEMDVTEGDQKGWWYM
jgi:hypothetical protein